MIYCTTAVNSIKRKSVNLIRYLASYVRNNKKQLFIYLLPVRKALTFGIEQNLL